MRARERGSHLLIVLLFLCEPKRPCMSRMGGPVEEPSGASWREKARGTASRLDIVFEKKRLAMRLHPGDLCIATWCCGGFSSKAFICFRFELEAQVISTAAQNPPELEH